MCTINNIYAKDTLSLEDKAMIASHLDVIYKEWGERINIDIKKDKFTLYIDLTSDPFRDSGADVLGEEYEESHSISSESPVLEQVLAVLKEKVLPSSLSNRKKTIFELAAEFNGHKFPTFPLSILSDELKAELKRRGIAIVYVTPHRDLVFCGAIEHIVERESQITSVHVKRSVVLEPCACYCSYYEKAIEGAQKIKTVTSSGPIQGNSYHVEVDEDLLSASFTIFGESGNFYTGQVFDIDFCEKRYISKDVCRTF